MQGIPHHLIDLLDPKEEFNVMIFQDQVKKCITEIIKRGNVPMLTGGTGFYIKAILKDVDFKLEEETQYREKLEALALENGPQYIHNELLKIDPESAQSIHSNNLRRTIRALEYYYQTGEKFSVHNRREASKPSPYQYIYFVLNDKRDLLYERINQRVDEMVENGLVEEVKKLIADGCTLDYVSMQGLGYKEIARYLQGEYSLEEAVYFIKRDTRHFAKQIGRAHV